MIKRVSVTNDRGDLLNMELANPWATGLAITSISGLSPSKATINTTEVTSNDGAIFNSSRVNSRNIVIKFKLLEVPSIEEVRRKTYAYFPVKKKIRLEFETDYRTAYIDGYVESNEVGIFSNSETSKISIICPDPYFIDSLDEGEATFGGITPKFSFPFACSPSTTGTRPEVKEFSEGDYRYLYVYHGGIITSQINLNQIDSIDYLGDADVGATFTIHIIGSLSNPKFYNYDTNEVMAIDTDKIASMTGEALKSGDDIIISTVRGNKSVQLLRDGAYTNILNALSKDSSWLQLTYGTNTFAYSADSGVTNMQFTITNKILYAGM